MTFLAPGFFYAALAVAAAVVALHFIVTRQPPAAMLPTARFVPDLPATATARATRPSDMLLLLLRTLLVLAMGTALARPVFRPSRAPVARVILLDASRATGNFAAARDSVRGLYSDGDVLVVFDSAARVISSGGLDSLTRIEAGRANPRLSAGFIAGLRAASQLRERADSVELVIVSSFSAIAWDAATDSLRGLWQGRARLVRLPLPADTTRSLAQLRQGSPAISEIAAADPLSATIRLVSSGIPDNVRVRRGPIGSEDSAWVEMGDRVLVEWPPDSPPAGAISRESPDTIGGVVSGNAIAIAAFARKWKLDRKTDGTRVVARWIDGEPAAIERPLGDGCVRSVAIPVTPVGDLVIRADFVKLTTALLGRCGGREELLPAPAAAITSLAGPRALAAREAFSARDDVKSPLAPWLLGIAIALGVLELFVRRSGTSSPPRFPRPRVNPSFQAGSQS